MPRGDIGKTPFWVAIGSKLPAIEMKSDPIAVLAGNPVILMKM